MARIRLRLWFLLRLSSKVQAYQQVAATRRKAWTVFWLAQSVEWPAATANIARRQYIYLSGLYKVAALCQFAGRSIRPPAVTGLRAQHAARASPSSFAQNYRILELYCEAIACSCWLQLLTYCRPATQHNPSTAAYSCSHAWHARPMKALVCVFAGVMKLQASHAGARQHAGRVSAQRAVIVGRSALRVSATAAPAAPPSTADITKQVVAEEAQYVLQTYARPSDIVFMRGKGSKLYDANDKEYLDMAAGMHAAPHVPAAQCKHMLSPSPVHNNRACILQ